MTRRIVFLDTETTHLDPRVADVWEIGLIIRDGNPDDDYDVSIMVEPSLDTADPLSLRINHYFDRARGVKKLREDTGDLCAEVYNCAAGPAVWSNEYRTALWLSETLLNAEIVGNNPAFDAAILERFMERNGGLHRPWYHRLVDVRQAAIGYLYGQAAAFRMAGTPMRVPDDLDLQPTNEVFKMVGIDVSEFQPQHEALPDARLARAVFDKLRAS